ncbi:hypothetical protein DFH09DRAFT_1474618 [Mycena vulgaris]|nr:hypothetical protein DFH09DRAFT_1474618 [Mycena vulgaris]
MDVDFGRWTFLRGRIRPSALRLGGKSRPSERSARSSCDERECGWGESSCSPGGKRARCVELPGTRGEARGPAVREWRGYTEWSGGLAASAAGSQHPPALSPALGLSYNVNHATNVNIRRPPECLPARKLCAFHHNETGRSMCFALQMKASGRAVKKLLAGLVGSGESNRVLLLKFTWRTSTESHRWGLFSEYSVPPVNGTPRVNGTAGKNIVLYQYKMQ